MPRGDNRRRSKCWCFTINNYTSGDVSRLSALEGSADYLCYGLEEAPITGTPHIQGYVRFRTRRTFADAKSAIGDTAHVEKAKGSDRDNRSYCSKDGKFTEFGRCAGRGHRSDLEAVVETVNQGASLATIAKQHPQSYIRYFRGISEYRQQTQRRSRTERTKVSSASPALRDRRPRSLPGALPPPLRAPLVYLT